MNEADRFRGCLLGLAVGDAVGTTLEFKARGELSPISHSVGMARPTLLDTCAKSGGTPAGGFDVSIIRTAQWGSSFKMTQNPSKYDGKSMAASLKPG